MTEYKDAIEELKTSIGMYEDNIDDWNEKLGLAVKEIERYHKLIESLNAAITKLEEPEEQVASEPKRTCSTCSLIDHDCLSLVGKCSGYDKWTETPYEDLLYGPQEKEPVAPEPEPEVIKCCNTCKRLGMTFLECTNGTCKCGRMSDYPHWEAKD